MVQRNLIIPFEETRVRPYPTLELAPPVLERPKGHHLDLAGLAGEAGQEVEGVFDDALGEDQRAWRRRLRLLLTCRWNQCEVSRTVVAFGGCHLLDAGGHRAGVLDADAQDDLASR